MSDIISDTNIRLIRGNGTQNVTPYEDAVVFHSALGSLHDHLPSLSNRSHTGVQVFSGLSIGKFDYTITGSTVKIGPGRGVIYGRQFVIDAGTFESVTKTDSYQFLHIYIQIDTTTTPETISVRGLTHSSPNFNLASTDIYKNESGVARCPLFTFECQGTVPKTLITDWREFRLPGVAPRALTLDADATINGVEVSELLDEQTGFVKNARHADVATTSPSIGPAGSTGAVKFGEGLMVDGSTTNGLMLAKTYNGAVTTIPSNANNMTLIDNIKNGGSIFLGVLFSISGKINNENVSWGGFITANIGEMGLFKTGIVLPPNSITQVSTYYVRYFVLKVDGNALKITSDNTEMTDVVFYCRSLFLGA